MIKQPNIEQTINNLRRYWDKRLEPLKDITADTWKRILTEPIKLNDSYKVGDHSFEHMTGSKHKNGND